MSSKTINELTLKLNADVAELKKDLAKAKGEMSNFQGGLKDIGAAIKNVFTVGAIVEVGKAVFNAGKELVSLGGQVAATKNEFAKLNQPGLLDYLKKETAGTISDMKLMQMSLNADDMGVGFEQLGTIMNYARNEVRQTGGDVQELVDKMVNGIGKDSTKAINELGISNKDFQSEFAKTGDKVTAITNIMQKRLKESGGVIETASDITARWGAKWENIKGAIGMMLNQALVKIAPVLDKIGTAILEAWNTAVDFIVDVYNGWVELYNGSVMVRAGIEAIKMVISTIWETLKLFFNLAVDGFKHLGKSIAYVINPSNWGKGFAEGMAKIMAESTSNVIGDFKNMGSNIGDAITDGIKNTINGNAGYITADDIMGLGGGSANIEEKAKATGKGIGKALTTGVKEELAKLDMKQITSVGAVTLPPIDASIMKSTLVTAKQELILELDNLGAMAAESLVTFTTDMVNGIGGGNGALSTVFRSIIGIVANFASTFGKQMIALGTAMVAAKLMIKNPYLAIAGGIALVALGAAAKKMLSSGGMAGFANGGIVPGYSFSGDRVPILANSGEMILNGGQQASLFNQLNGGGSGNSGGVLSCKISGDDLWFLLDKSEKRKSYIY
jgi:hypothetical protein